MRLRYGKSPGLSPLLIADGTALLVSSVCNLSCAVELFTAQCELAGKRLSTSKPEVVFLTIRGEQIYQLEELEYL